MFLLPLFFLFLISRDELVPLNKQKGHLQQHVPRPRQSKDSEKGTRKEGGVLHWSTQVFEQASEDREDKGMEHSEGRYGHQTEEKRQEQTTSTTSFPHFARQSKAPHGTFSAYYSPERGTQSPQVSGCLKIAPAK